MAQRDERGMTTVRAPVFWLERLNLTVPLLASLRVLLWSVRPYANRMASWMIARAFCYCTLCILVIEAQDRRRLWWIYTHLSKVKAWRHWMRSPTRSSGSVRLLRGSTLSAKGSPASSLNWKQLSVCSLGIARALG